MIIKSFEISKININKKKLILFYGNNEGLKKETINKLIKNKNEIHTYEESDILNNEKNFLESLLSQSLFEKEKVLIIKRASDRLFKILTEVYERNFEDILIIINCNNLEKRSKLRSFFEKEKELICVPFYADNEQTLSQLAINFFKKKRIAISKLNINQIINRCNGDRENLFNELSKIESFSKNGKKLEPEIIMKLTNLSENHSISELVDSCLTKNYKKLIYILNENNLTNEDCIIIIRTILNKSKKILKLLDQFEINKDMNLTISLAKPPIFWKDKEIIKLQMKNWNQTSIKNLIYKIGEIEFLIKKNINNSLNITTDFLLEHSLQITNN
ncbi:DNA polymerase III subunit delta [Candidatus Pelagibacter sp.]|nr:DNA polymerase III subunit delta [Candidatus Pelagibacter sp.]